MDVTVDCSWAYSDYQTATRMQRGIEVLSPTEFVRVFVQFTEQTWGLDVGPFKHNGVRFDMSPRQNLTGLLFLSLKQTLVKDLYSH